MRLFLRSKPALLSLIGKQHRKRHLMNTRKLLSISLASGLAGAVFSALLFSSITSSNAAVSTSGYYVCANKASGALRMSPDSNKCKSTEYRYFFTSTVDQTGTGNSQNTQTISFLAPEFGNCPGSSLGTSFVTRVSWNGSTYNPLTVYTQPLQTCQLTVSVP